MSLIWHVAHLESRATGSRSLGSRVTGSRSNGCRSSGKTPQGVVPWDYAARVLGVRETLHPTTYPVQKFCKVNRASVLAMPATGKDRAAAARFSAFMNLPAPILPNSWSQHTKVLGDITTDVCDKHFV